MKNPKAEELATEIAWWLFWQDNDILSHPEALAEGIEKFLLSRDDL